MQEKLFLNQKQNLLLIVIGVAFILFYSIYVSYEINRYKMLQDKSIIKNNIVMKIIQHNVKSVCPYCGTKGIPVCPQCGVDMYWNGYRGNFICSACGQGGFPNCPRCKKYMTWIQSK